MSYLYDAADPTAALFTSQAGASKASSMVFRDFSDRVKRTLVKRRVRQGQMLGWVVLIERKDNLGDLFPLTNSDFERLSA